jgi:hypothetical protein
MRALARVGLALVLAVVCAGSARAQDPADPDAALRQRKQTAVTKGCRWLCEQQKPDGSWTYDNSPLQLQAYPMTSGVTALCAYTLLRCGIDPDDEHIEKAFAFIRSQDLQWTYAVSCILLAIEARANYEPPPADEPSAGTSERRRHGGRRTPADMALAQRCLEFLHGNQQVGLWRYPSGAQEDVSNTQYALLALDAAERLGLSVPRDMYEKVVVRLLEAQEKDGPVVPTFPVPGADRTYRELKKMQADLEKQIHSLERRYRRDPDKPDGEGLTLHDRTETVERGAAARLLETNERATMKARGWAYFPPGMSGQPWQMTANGSMTASGLAALFICKSHLEGTARYERELKPQVDQALRDGAAWLAKNFSVAQNPCGQLHHYYYMYGLERAGILGLIGRFGTHDWFDEGCDMFLGHQGADGGWNAQFQGTAGAVPDTCFALLFVCRGTTPVVSVPRRVMTGGGAPAPAPAQPQGQ